MKKNYIILVFFLFIIRYSGISQDVTNLFERFKQKPQLTGGFNFSQTLYKAYRISERREPYTYFLNGNINISVWGWNIPISATYSNEQFQYTYPTFKILPFNQYGISPYYKWIKLYIGYNSMSFSNYSMSGRTFFGGGIELTPGAFTFSAMYGKIQNAVDTDSINNVPVFKRMAFAIKTGYKKNSDFIEMVIFWAKDDTNSIKYYSSELEISPMENLILNANVSKSFFKTFVFTFDYATSTLTKDLSKQKGYEKIPFFYNYPDFIFKHRTTTVYSKAFKSMFSYSEKDYSVGIAYEYIDPDYQSLGTFYFTNDFENLTLNGSIKLLGNKLNLSGNFGIEQNDLKSLKVSSNKRFVTSFNTSIIFSEKISTSASYSNFTSHTVIKNELEDITNPYAYKNLDTLNYTQINQNASLNASFLIGDVNEKKVRKNFNINFNYQRATENQANSLNNKFGTNFYNSNLTYIHSLTPKNLTLSSSIMLNYTQMDTNSSITIGPSFSLGKGFYKNKIKTVISTSYCNIFSNNIVMSKVLNTRMTASYTFKKKHNFNLSLSALNRFKTEYVSGFFEFTGIFSYSFNF